MECTARCSWGRAWPWCCRTSAGHAPGEPGDVGAVHTLDIATEKAPGPLVGACKGMLHVMSCLCIHGAWRGSLGEEGEDCSSHSTLWCGLLGTVAMTRPADPPYPAAAHPHGPACTWLA